MPKCVLAKPCNPSCDQEGMRVGGNDVDWVIPQGPAALPSGLCMLLNDDFSPADRSAFHLMNE